MPWGARPDHAAEGIPGNGRREAAVGAGTGLGVRMASRDGLHHPIPRRRAHRLWPPLNPEQDRLPDFLRSHCKQGVRGTAPSGPASSSYRFCAGEAGKTDLVSLDEPIPPRPSACRPSPDQDAAVHAMNYSQPSYGRVAGDIALLTQAGHLPSWRHFPKDPACCVDEFLAGFHAKGRFSD